MIVVAAPMDFWWNSTTLSGVVALCSDFRRRPTYLFAFSFCGVLNFSLALYIPINYSARNNTWSEQLYRVNTRLCCSSGRQWNSQGRWQRYFQVEDCVVHHHHHPYSWDLHLHHLCWWKPANMECTSGGKIWCWQKRLVFGNSITRLYFYPIWGWCQTY